MLLYKKAGKYKVTLITCWCQQIIKNVCFSDIEHKLMATKGESEERNKLGVWDYTL